MSAEFERFEHTELHWKLIQATGKSAAMDAAIDDDGFVSAQALFCPYYVTLEGVLGSDWGVIVNPRSKKFGQLVFEHHWCGCPVAQGENTFEYFAIHGCGNQRTDQWLKPKPRKQPAGQQRNTQ